MTVDLTLVLTAHRTEHLREAVDSLACQTDLDFHLICCADRTGDPAVTGLLGSLTASLRCRGVSVFSTPGGTGGATRNAAFAAAESNWVGYIDGDDVLSSDAVSVMKTTINEVKGDMYSSGMHRILRSGESVPLPDSLTYRPPAWIYTLDPDEVGHRTYFNQFLVLRRRLWEGYPFYEETNGEDIDFMLHQLLRGVFVKVPHDLYGFRDTPDSFSKRQYPGGDLCTNRYRIGYYRYLFEHEYADRLAGNFERVDSSP